MQLRASPGEPRRGRGHGQRRRGRSATGHASQTPDDEPPFERDPFDDEDPFGGEESDSGPFDDEPLDKDPEDEQLDHDFEDAAVHSCGLSRLHPGRAYTRPRVEHTGDGALFSQIQLLR